MNSPLIVTEADIRAATWQMQMHLNLGRNGHQMTYACSAFPELMVCKGWRRKKGGGRDGYAVMQLRRGGGDCVEIPLGDLDEVARLLTKVRQGAAHDIEWEKADPTRQAIEAVAEAARDELSEGRVS